MNDYYPLKPFRITSQGTLCGIMRQWPLATMISGTAGQALTSLIPLVIKEERDGSLSLLGHLDVNNEHATAIRAGAPVSFLFRSPDTYASPDLYDDPQLPGWLYVSVKGDGNIESVLGDDELKDLLIDSTSVFGKANQDFALDRNDERIDQFIGGILGFKIQVTHVSGVAKLAQDKSPVHARQAAAFFLSQANESATRLINQLLDETLVE